MQSLFIICCLLAVTSAGLVYPSSYGHDFLSQQVQHAKIEHFLAKAQAEVQQAYGYDHHNQFAGLDNSHVYGDYADSVNSYGHHHGW
ncbi:hypothetical protein CBL_02780 [Carabus blaptoides fortunei]